MVTVIIGHGTCIALFRTESRVRIVEVNQETVVKTKHQTKQKPETKQSGLKEGKARDGSISVRVCGVEESVCLWRGRGGR